MRKKEFLKKYKIDEIAFDETGLEWEDLWEIYTDYCNLQVELEPILNMVADVLRKHEKVHSIKQRLKNPEHLIEKIIRKKIKHPERDITIENYKEEITDLLGIRVIHLFKEDWESIHQYIVDRWELKEPATANVRRGDDETTFKKNSCEIKQHPYGYRSVHYLIQVKPFRQEFTVELQVRTIFEEGWSEIDHQIRYPYDIDNTIIANYLVMFNRIAGSADEMGSYIRFLHEELSEIKRKHEAELEEKNQAIKELEDLIDNSRMEDAEKEEIRNKISTLVGVIAKAATQVDPFLMKQFSASLMTTLNSMALEESEKEAFKFFLNGGVDMPLLPAGIGEVYRELTGNEDSFEEIIIPVEECKRNRL